MNRHAIIIAAASLVLAACGPKGPAKEPKGGTQEEGQSDVEAGKSDLQKLVDRLNSAIAEGNEAEIKALIEPQTADLIVEFMGLVPEWEPVGDDVGLVDYLDWEKENGVSYVLRDDDENSGTLVAQVDGLESFEGLVTMVGSGEDAQLEFLDFAAERRDQILSDGIAREKLIESVDNVNKAIDKKDAKLLQENLSNETINKEVELYSYFTSKKSNLSPKGLVKWFKENGYTFKATKVNVSTGEAMLTVTDGDGNEVLKGEMMFKSEIGKMRLEYSPLLQTRIDEERAKLEEKKGKKGKKGKNKGK